jgi:hypothetical protein
MPRGGHNKMPAVPHQVGDAHGRLGASRVAHHHHTAAACQATYRLAREGSPERVDDDIDAAGSELGKPVVGMQPSSSPRASPAPPDKTDTVGI